jgi:hypothetical protein
MTNRLKILSFDEYQFFSRDGRITSIQRRQVQTLDFSFLANNSNKNYDDPFTQCKFEETSSSSSFRNEILASISTNPTLVEYFNCIRREAIKRMKQLRDEIITKVKGSPLLSKCDPNLLRDDEELTELRRQVFRNSRFCFQIDLCKNIWDDANDFIIIPENNDAGSSAHQQQFQQVNSS